MKAGFIRGGYEKGNVHLLVTYGQVLRIKHINKAMHHTSKFCGTVAKNAPYQGAH